MSSTVIQIKLYTRAEARLINTDAALSDLCVTSIPVHLDLGDKKINRSKTCVATGEPGDGLKLVVLCVLEELAELSCDRTLKIQFREKSLSAFGRACLLTIRCCPTRQ